MKFTPYNIKNQEFNQAFRGFDKEEVLSFLEAVAAEFGTLISENDKLQKQVDSISKELEEFKRVEKSLQSTLVNATETSTRAVESAKKQQQLIIREAEIKAAQILEKVKDEAAQVRESILKLQDEKKLIISKIKAIIESQTKIFELSANYSSQQVISEPVREEKTKIDVDDILEKLL